MLSGNNYCNCAGRITSAACILWHWFTIEESYGDSHWLIGLLLLTQGSVSQLTNSPQSDRTWLFITGLSLPHFYSFLVSLSLAPKFLLCPAHVCVIAVIIDRHSPSLKSLWSNTEDHEYIITKPSKLAWKKEGETMNLIMFSVMFCCICCCISVSHLTRCPRNCTWTHTHGWVHVWDITTTQMHLGTHAHTNKLPQQTTPCTHTHTCTETNTFFQGAPQTPYSRLLCPAFVVSKSARSEPPVKLTHIKRDIREVNTAPYSVSGEVTKHYWTERGRGGRSWWGLLVKCAEESRWGATTYRVQAFFTIWVYLCWIQREDVHKQNQVHGKGILKHLHFHVSHK